MIPKYKNLLALLLVVILMALTSCGGINKGMNYGIKTGNVSGGAAIQPHFNAGVYVGGRVW